MEWANSFDRDNPRRRLAEKRLGNPFFEAFNALKLRIWRE
jgi:hypothetical protein